MEWYSNSFSQLTAVSDDAPSQSATPLAAFVREFKYLMTKFGDGTRPRKVSRTVLAASLPASDGAAGDAPPAVPAPPPPPPPPILVPQPYLDTARSIVSEAFDVAIPGDPAACHEPVPADAYATVVAALGPLAQEIMVNAMLAAKPEKKRYSYYDGELHQKERAERATRIQRLLVSPVLKVLLDTSSSTSPSVAQQNTDRCQRSWRDFHLVVQGVVEVWLASFFPFVQQGVKIDFLEECPPIATKAASTSISINTSSSPLSASQDPAESGVAGFYDEAWRGPHVRGIAVMSTKLDLRRDVMPVVPKAWLHAWFQYAQQQQGQQQQEEDSIPPAAKTAMAPPGPILSSDMLAACSDGDGSGAQLLVDQVEPLPEHIFLPLWHAFGGANLQVNLTTPLLASQLSAFDEGRFAALRAGMMQRGAQGQPIELSGAFNDAALGMDEEPPPIGLSVCLPLAPVVQPTGTAAADAAEDGMQEVLIFAALQLQDSPVEFPNKAEWIDELLIGKNIVESRYEPPDPRRAFVYRAPVRMAGRSTSYRSSSYTALTAAHRGICGLTNLGNTCFMNSVLQCLSNSGLFRRALLASPLSLAVPAKSLPHSVAACLQDVMRRLWCGQEDIVTPTELKAELGKRVRRFAGYEQHDAIDYLHSLLDKVHFELNPVVRKLYRERRDEDMQLPMQVLAQQFWQDFIKNDASCIVEQLYGQYRTRVCCKACGYVSIAYENEMNLSVSINRPTLMNVSVTLHMIEFPAACTDDDGVDQPPPRLAKKVVNVSVFQEGTIADVRVALRQKLGFADTVDLAFVTTVSWASKFLADDEPAAPRWGWASSPATFVAFVPYIPPIPTSSSSSNPTAGDTAASLDSEPPLSPAAPSAVAEGDTAPATTLILLEAQQQFFKKFHVALRVPATLLETELVPIFQALGSLLFRTAEDTFTSVKAGFWALRERPAGSEVYECALAIDVNAFLSAVDDAHAAAAKVSAPALTLEACLDDMNAVGTLSGDDQWYCSKCQHHQDAEISLRIYRLPPVLLIHLKRFKASASAYGGTSKIESVVEFPLVMDVSRFVVDEQDEENDNDAASNPRSAAAAGSSKKKLPQWYALRGVIYHGGSLEGGHYTAGAFSESARSWATFNDSYAHMESGPPSPSGAYILLYEKIASPSVLPAGPYGLDSQKADDGGIVDTTTDNESQTKKAKTE